MSTTPINALLERLRTDTALAEVVFDTEAKQASGGVVQPPYVVVYSNAGDRVEARLTGSQTRNTTTFTIHSVGATAEQARAVSRKLYALLLGYRPTVSGQTCWPFKAVVSQPVRLDKDVLPAVYYGVDEFQLMTTPA